jgi:ribosome-binding ATPase YchF (GTP1/OBG family)
LLEGEAPRAACTTIPIVCADHHGALLVRLSPETDDMQLGITGLAKTGKTTLFNLLTSSHEATDKFTKSTEAHIAVTKVPDARLDALAAMYEPQKFTPATIQFVDIPGVEHHTGTFDHNLDQLRDVDALVHVVRGFHDPEIIHPEGSVDPARDIESLDLELILADLDLIERRLARLEQSEKRGLTADEKRERSLLDETVRPALEAETPVRQLELDADDQRRLRGFHLLSSKPMLIVLNLDESDLAGATTGTSIDPGARSKVVVMSLPIEEEIAQLPIEEQQEFLAALELEQASLDRAIRAARCVPGRSVAVPPPNAPAEPFTPTSSVASSAPRSCPGTSFSIAVASMPARRPGRYASRARSTSSRTVRSCISGSMCRGGA